MHTSYASKHEPKSGLAEINLHLHHNINEVEHEQICCMHGKETYDIISNIMSLKKTYADKLQVPQAGVQRRSREGFLLFYFIVAYFNRHVM